MDHEMRHAADRTASKIVETGFTKATCDVNENITDMANFSINYENYSLMLLTTVGHKNATYWFSAEQWMTMIGDKKGITKLTPFLLRKFYGFTGKINIKHNIIHESDADPWSIARWRWNNSYNQNWLANEDLISCGVECFAQLRVRRWGWAQSCDYIRNAAYEDIRCVLIIKYRVLFLIRIRVCRLRNCEPKFSWKWCLFGNSFEW